MSNSSFVTSNRFMCPTVHHLNSSSRSSCSDHTARLDGQRGLMQQLADQSGQFPSLVAATYLTWRVLGVARPHRQPRSFLMVCAGVFMKKPLSTEPPKRLLYAISVQPPALISQPISVPGEAAGMVFPLTASQIVTQSWNGGSCCTNVAGVSTESVDRLNTTISCGCVEFVVSAVTAAVPCRATRTRGSGGV